MLESWVTPRSGTQAQACAVLASFRELDALKRMARYVGSKKGTYQMRQTILRAMAAHPFGTSQTLDEGVEQVLYRGLQIKDPRLRYYALDGSELPCCFIKDTSTYQGLEAIHEIASRGETPPQCQGCVHGQQG